MRSFFDYIYLARDFWRYLRGKDYFRQPQGLGSYFYNNRCYYNDLTGKALWDGKFQDGLPVLYVPSSGKTIFHPCMLLLWGQGSLDRYFLDNEVSFLDNAERTTRWLVDNILPAGYWCAYLAEFDPEHRYYSDNSCMNQGIALSFLTRIIQNKLFDTDLRLKLEDLTWRVAENMLLPLDKGGTARERGVDLYLYEGACVNECVVLNGWVFGLFGLWDHAHRTADPMMNQQLNRTIGTLQRSLPLFIRDDGWSYYDTAGRLASPFYHDLHINLLEALYLLTDIGAFCSQMKAYQKGNSAINRLWYTLSKIKDKLRDKQSYASQT